MKRLAKSVPPAEHHRDDERASLERTYAAYAASGGRRRAWDATNPGNVAIRSELLEHLIHLAGEELAEGGEILDIGCGGGWWLERLTMQGVAPSRLHGIELLENRAASARARLHDADIRWGDATALPYADRSMQLVLLFTVLSSVTRDAANEVLRESRRVVAPGGRILVYEPRVPNPFNRRTRLIARRELESALGPVTSSVSLTVLPAMVRRLGRFTPSLYPHLGRVSPLRTHVLRVFRPAPLDINPPHEPAHPK